ncbi:hypothetical protein [Micromonospora sp. WMMD1082]|uniref:hypothetical protein n=1 Tax=Micromonospora sp. WMMD1082 TaxID=3016104 RepID=UPI002415E728|nr:hypothetical protein [Micromonospora sp. WMMD1082]MDG4794539.1 hypothetical protein [Micromonospora sp. WMMD1082]
MARSPGTAMTATGLREALDALFVVPPEHRWGDVGRAEARALLSCDEPTLSALVRHGLPTSGHPDGDRFDSRDLFNLGLHSVGHDTVVARTFALALRWMRAGTDRLVAGRPARLDVNLSCGGPQECGAGARSHITRPRPEVYGGSVESLHMCHRPGGEQPAGTPPPGLRMTARLRLTGQLAPLRSAAARDAVRHFLDVGLRWVKLPGPLQADVRLARSHGIASCASASLHLAHLLQSAGLDATTRVGWVIGLEMEHAWVEVVDTDGETKLLDPVFALFAGMLPGANPAFRDADHALRTNRLVPTALPAGAALAVHSCDGPPATPRVAVTTSFEKERT